MKIMKKYHIILCATLALTSCLKDFQDTSFAPQKAEISYSIPDKTVDKDAQSFEIALNSNLPWRASSASNWLSVKPQRGMGDETLTITVQKNRTVEERTGYIRVYVTSDQYKDFFVTQGSSEGGQANVYYVRVDGNASASGLSWGNATTMTAALEQASDGDCIYVAAGTYSPELPLTSSDSGDKCNRTFEIHSNFSMIGGFPADSDDSTFDPEIDYDPSSNVTVLDGNVESALKAYHVVTVTALKTEGKKAVLKGFTISGGETSAIEGSVSVNGSSYDLGYGGGLFIGPSNLEIADCIITGNNARQHAGGVYVKAGATVNMERCRIQSNTSESNAGGMWNSGASVYMNQCTIADNISGQMAGGYYSIDSGGSPSVSRIYNSTLSGNDCTTRNAGRSGGGAYIREYSDAVFVNCTFYGNKGGNGGAVQAYGGNGRNSKLTLISCTVTGNSATLLGGGISLWNNYNTTKIYNCIISGNTTSGSGADIGYGSAIGSNVPNLDYENSIVGPSLYSTTGNVKGGWTFDASTMLNTFGFWGGLTKTCTLVSSGSNPACSEGMSKETLGSIGASLSPAVDLSIFDYDQRMEERTTSTIGSCTL